MNQNLQKQIIVPSAYHNQRIDIILAELLPEYSRSQLASWIKSGAIILNQKNAKPKDKAYSGDIIDINVSFAKEDTLWNNPEPENIPLAILFEDDELFVLNKPAGLVVHPGAGNREHTLVNALVHYRTLQQNLPRAGIIHRLDKDTTGVLLVAKTLSAQTALVRQMQARSIQRHYLALVQGHLLSGGTIDTHFGRHPKNRLKMAVLQQGRQAITHYAIKKHYMDFTLLDVHLMTGRTHQIRVHMAHLKHPIVGDPLYGGKVKCPKDASPFLIELIQQFKRQALHAYSITFTHPVTEQTLTFSAPLPDDFERLLKEL